MDSRRFGKYRVERDVLDEQRLEEVTQRKSYTDTHPSLTDRLKDSLKRCVMSSLPVLYWLPKYSVWDYGMPDLVSGISVGIMHLPQGMAYALLASLPPVFGLYTSLYPPLIYLFFGTSRHISIGTFTVLSIMVGSVTERLAPDAAFIINNGTNITTEVDVTARDLYRVQVAAATTVLGGLIQVVLGMVKFGFVGTYLSEPLVHAYTTAASAHAVVAQLKYVFGVSPTRFNGPLSLVYVSTIKYLAVIPNAVSMAFLITAKELNSFLSPKLPVPIPVELITVSLHKDTLALSSPRAPDINLFQEVIGDAFALAIVGYAISFSLGKTFALKHGYKVDSNQELVALGLSNTVGGFFQCFSVCPSMSRSLIQESTGGKTQMAGLASAVIVLEVLQKNKIRLHCVLQVVWLVTLVSTLLFNLDLGLAGSISFALLTVIFRTQM
uniref:Solute carrier family 26 member 6-like n=1 Tax=Sphaeramia orbicularis TaxID=375764 RepID=A0A672Y9L2_9TELE